MLTKIIKYLKSMKTKSVNTQDSHQEKLSKGSILVMDLASLPREHGLDLATWVKLIKEQGVAFYDSNKGNAPFYTNEKQTIVTYDVQEEKAMGELEAILKEEEIKYKEELSNVENIRISPRDLETSGNITFAPSITSDTPQVTITTTDSIASGTMLFGTGGEIQNRRQRRRLI